MSSVTKLNPPRGFKGILLYCVLVGLTVGMSNAYAFKRGVRTGIAIGK